MNTLSLFITLWLLPSQQAFTTKYHVCKKNTYTLVYTFIFFGRFVFHLVSKIYLVQSKISKTSSIYPHSDKCHVCYPVAVGV